MICRIVSITKKEIAGRIDGDGGKKNVVGIAAVHDFFANKSMVWSWLRIPAQG